MPGVGWKCSTCTYHHSAPGTRCVMCGNLRVSKEQMRDFVLGKTIPKTNEAAEVIEVNPQLDYESVKENLPSSTSPTASTSASASASASTFNPLTTAPAAASSTTNRPTDEGESSTTTTRPGLGPAFHNPYARKAPPAWRTTTPTQAPLAACQIPVNPPRGNSKATASPSLPEHPTLAIRQRPTLPLQGGPSPVSGETANATSISTAMYSTALSRPQPQLKLASPIGPLEKPPPSAAADNIWSRSIRPIPMPFATGPILLSPATCHDWVYPLHTKYPVRDYQLEISKTAVLHNTLVSLPTGLGKTLIAAVVLYNYYRWFPTGKVLFLAPTLPLVHQQVKACYDIMGIPAEDTAILTGRVSAKERAHLWQARRVFFCTPQTVQRDIEHHRCPTSHVVCVVMDEAHKACGAYAYVQVMEQLEHAQAKFRVLGLSATPGSEIKAIQKVITALNISKIEVRLDDDPDVKKYIHERHNELVVVKQGSAITTIERLLVNLIAPVLDRLRKENALTHIRGNATLTPFCLIKAKEAYLERTGDRQLDSYFLTALKFVEIRCHLRRTGIGIVRSKMLAIQNSSRGLLTSVMRSNAFREVMEAVLMSSSEGHVNETAEDRMLNNPKLLKLDEILKEHFERSRACGESSRAIVFSQWRESVSEIVQVLSSGQTLLRPRHFVGQGKSSGGTRKQDGSTVDQNCVSLKGMRQSEQQQVIKDFQEGHYNILVCTCIGEEGLDIGEVDLIVNFDTLRSPIRMIQRVGRTGRKRDGRVVCLVSEGQEEKTMRASKAAEKTLGRALKKPGSFKFARSIPMFPKAPELRMTDMSISTSFRMSQVGGHGPSAKIHDAKVAGSSKPLTSLDTTDAWRLSDAQETKRLAMYGELDYSPCSDLKSRNGRISSAVLDRFLRGRLRAYSKCEQNETLGFGPTRKILALLDRQYGSVLKRTWRRPRRRSSRDMDVVGRLFPFDSLPFDKRMGRPNPSPPRSVSDQPLEPNRDLGCAPIVLPVRPELKEQISAVRNVASLAVQDASRPPARATLDARAACTQHPQQDSCRQGQYGKPDGASPLNDTIDFPDDVKASANDTTSFVLPTPSDSSSEESSSEQEAQPTANHVAPGKDQFQTATKQFPASSLVQSEVVQQVGDSSEEEEEEEDIPLQDLRLPTQESSSDDDDESPELRESGGFTDKPPTCTSRAAIPRVEESTSMNPRSKNFMPQTTPTSLSTSNPFRPTPAPPSGGDCLIDTPPDAAVPEEDIEDILCVVCYSGDSSGDNLIVLCDGPHNDLSCNLAVHTQCYPITMCLDGLDHWRCDPCEAKQNGQLDLDTSCVLCKKSDGPIVALPDCGDRAWIHSYCRPWVDVPSLLLCQYCAVPGAVGCSVKSCNAFAHPHCALTLTDDHWRVTASPSSSGASELVLVCSNHCRSAWKSPRFVPVVTGQFQLNRDEHGVQDKPRMKRLKKKSSFQPESTIDEKLDDAEDSDDLPERKRQRVHKRLKNRKRGMLISRFLVNEAEIDSEEDVDGDIEDDDALQQIEDDEAFHSSFINDSSQLGAATQDELDGVEESFTVHRAFDNEKERMHQFSTPVFNRRMTTRDGKTHTRTPVSHHEWAEPTPASVALSQTGLGNMHFIRSVLEHHRNGGEADEIEALYHQVEEEHQSSEDQAKQLDTQREPLGPVAMNYVASDSEDESGYESVQVSSSNVQGFGRNGLSKEQHISIEAKRQEALRRRQEISKHTHLDP